VATEGCFKSDATAGEKNVKAKLNWEIVKEIRRRQAEGLKYGQIKAMAIEFGVSEISIQNILRNKTWVVV
jgi:translation elongation factor EF-1beta